MWTFRYSVGLRSVVLGIAFLALPFCLFAQMTGTTLKCEVVAESGPLMWATVYIPELDIGGITDSQGMVYLEGILNGDYDVEASYVGYFTQKKRITVHDTKNEMVSLFLSPKNLEEIVVTGTMRETRRSDSPIPVDIISSRLFLRNPSPNFFESVGMISGVQPVINCNVCNTGDIQINGMEGVYTQVLLDGMPIVSGLGTVYGLMGIPNNLIDRIEVVKGPAGALYGSEAMAGQINIITKKPLLAPQISADIFATSWGETNLDVGGRVSLGNRLSGLIGANGFWFQNPIDNNGDGFTDVAQQKRLSLFNIWEWRRPQQRVAQLGARYVWEDRWGGQTHWTPAYKGGDVRYAETILTNRLEVFGQYQLPLRAPVFLQASFSSHQQASFYGIVPYDARQDIAFIQAYWKGDMGRHHLMVGTAARYTLYNDNTPATQTAERTLLPGFFVQDEWDIGRHSHLLSGLRVDIHPEHGEVWSPRLAWHQHVGENQQLRMSGGSGFRVVSLFTEDHAALSGSRDVILAEQLEPERSWSFNLNYNLNVPREAFFLNLDVNAFYTHFTNKIIPDYDTHPQQIIYANLDGHAVTRGVTMQLDYSDGLPVRWTAGVTIMDVFQQDEEGNRSQQIRAPMWSGVFSGSYTHTPSQIAIDVTGNWFGPQRLPVVPNDFRPDYSPWYALVNLKVSRKFAYGFEAYIGVKNIFNFIPDHPILRPFDPFDKTANDPVNNPHGYTFDPNYNYAPLQGIRGYFGVRYQW